MSFFREAGESLARLSGVIMAKTEEFSRIAQISLEQKRLESSLTRLERASGRFFLSALVDKGSCPEAEDPSVVQYLEQYRELVSAIESKKEEILSVRRDYTRTDQYGNGNTENR